jgi:hypothetical protein
MNSRRIAGRLAALTPLAVAVGLITAAPSFAVHQTAYGLTTQDPSQLVSFAVGTPGTVTGPTAITGLTGPGDNLIGIDYRPRSNTLYAEADNGQLYTLAPPAGAVTTFTATPLDIATDPADVDSGFDFNPVPDRLRVNNTADENFRINVDNGVTIADGALAFAGTDANAGDNPAVGAAAYTNNIDGATTTTLFDIEATNNALVVQNPPNNGTLNTVGTLPGGDITSVAGFDIETQTGNAYAALQTTGATASTFYRLDLTNGAALNTFGPIGGGQLIEGVALPLIPVLAYNEAARSVSEGELVALTVTRTGELNQAATVEWVTELGLGDNATTDDFATQSGTISFAPGQASQSFSVATNNDTLDEVDERFSVRLRNPSASANLGGNPVKVNIVDNDDAAPGNAGVAPLGLISVPSQPIDRSIKAKFVCDESCAAKLKLKLGSKVLDKDNASQGEYGNTKVVFALSKKEVKKVKNKAKGKDSAKLSASGTFSDADGSTKSKVKFLLG